MPVSLLSVYNQFAEKTKAAAKRIPVVFDNEIKEIGGFDSFIRASLITTGAPKYGKFNTDPEWLTGIWQIDVNAITGVGTNELLAMIDYIIKFFRATQFDGVSISEITTSPPIEDRGYNFRAISIYFTAN